MLECRIEDDLTLRRAPETAEEANDLIAEMKETSERFNTFADICRTKMAYYNAQLNNAQRQYDDEVSYKLSLLNHFMDGAPTKKAKASESIKLPDGTIRRKFATAKIVPDNDALVKEYKGTQYVEAVPKLKWGELKANLIIKDGKVIDTTTGAVVEGASIESVEAEISIS